MLAARRLPAPARGLSSKPGLPLVPPGRGAFAGALGLALAILLLFIAGGLGGAEEVTLAWRFALRGERAPDAPVAVVAIDEGSLARLGQFPWDRHRFAALLDRLHADGARVVGFDVALVEPGRQAPGEDEALSKAMAAFGPVVLPTFRAPAWDPYGMGRTDLVRPLPALASRAAGLGMAQFSSQNERDVVSVAPVQRIGALEVPALGVAIARAAGGDLPPTSPWFRDRPIDLDYLGGVRSIPTYPFWKVISGEVPAATLRGRTVLVGATATGLPDTGFVTPQGAPIAGVEIHATTVENLLGKGPLRRFRPEIMALFLLLLALFPGSWLLEPRQGALARWALAAACLPGCFGVAWLAFVHRIWLDLAPLWSLVIACTLIGAAWQSLHLLAERNATLAWYAAALRQEARREREQIDGELHDEAQQLLIVLQRELRLVSRGLGAGSQPVQDSLTRAQELTIRILDEIHRVRRNLAPRTLGRSGLITAIEEMAQDLATRGLQVSVERLHWDRGLDARAEEELYWLVKEALNNAARHAGARRATVTLDATAGCRWITVQDDGQGFVPPPLDRPPATHEHTGLHRMWLRARSLGGDLTVTSRPGEGTMLRAQLPRRGENGDG